MRIDPKLVLEFAAIAEECSFTKAAQRLRVAQPWLSMRLSRLEEILGFRLFDRTTRRVSLTDRGAEFLEAAKDLVKAAEAADHLAVMLARRNDGRLRIGTAPYGKIIRERRELIDTFAQTRPDVKLELEAGWVPSLLARLDAGEIDLSFILGEVDPSRYEAILLKTYGIGLTMLREHPLAAASCLLPEAVAQYPVLVYPRGPNVELWDALYAPLIAVGANLIEVPELPDSPPSPDAAIAFLDFGADIPASERCIRIPLDTPATVPFQLVRPINRVSEATRDLWEIARARKVSSVDGPGAAKEKLVR